jgi:hypothetical protein
VYAEKAGAFFCPPLGFEHVCSYIAAAAGAQEREVKDATNICEKSRRNHPAAHHLSFEFLLRG